MSYMVLLEKLMVRKYIWLNLFNVSLRSVGEQPCVRLRGGQCFSPQKIPSHMKNFRVWKSVKVWNWSPHESV